VGAPGPSVLCLHGLGRDPADWDGVRAGLERFGEVAAPALPRTSVDELTETLATLPPASIVVGHSVGGVLALRRAALHDATRAVVVTSGFFPLVVGERTRRAAVTSYAAHRVALARQLAARGSRPRPRRGAARLAGSLVRLGLDAPAFHAVADAVRAPVLVVHGSDDHHVPVDFAVAAAARQPGFTLSVLAGAGHDVHAEQPERWLDVVTSWLDEVLASPGRRSSVA
jgi:pimeloyl-ACP methyl ester carboxylesterase